MFPALLLMVATAAAECPPPTFAFVGQPDCVTLAFEDGTTQVTNACEHPILFDQSVHLPTTATTANRLVPAKTSTTIRDLSVFTLGMNGELYRVVAMIALPEGCEVAG